VRLAIACGKSAEAFLRDMLARYPVSGVDIAVYGLENTWFGPTVTVSGLITGGDLMRQMRGVPCDAIMITEVMLKENENRFLDDTTLPQVMEALGKPVVPVGRQGGDLLDAILRLRDEP
jgi:NifB/MoaA-like Fe-S oxidoreductase